MAFEYSEYLTVKHDALLKFFNRFSLMLYFVSANIKGLCIPNGN